MLKTLAALVISSTLLLASSVALAFPAPSDLLIRTLLTNPQFTEVLKRNAGDDQFRSTFAALTITMASMNDSYIREMCKNDSRSGSILKVKLGGIRGPVYYFSTPESPADLKLCE